MKRNTKHIGDVSEITVIGAFIRSGYFVSIPFGENQRYDFLADKDGVISRIQVKTGRLRDGAILFNAFSSHFNRGNVTMRRYHGEIDFFAVYCQEVAAVFVVPLEVATDRGYLRWEASRNGQTKKIHRAEQYLLSHVDPPNLVGAARENGVTT